MCRNFCVEETMTTKVPKSALLWSIMRTMLHKYDAVNIIFDDMVELVAKVEVDDFEVEWGWEEDRKCDYCPFNVYVKGGYEHVVSYLIVFLSHEICYEKSILNVIIFRMKDTSCASMS